MMSAESLCPIKKIILWFVLFVGVDAASAPYSTA